MNIIRVNGVSRSYGSKKVVDNISFSVNEGEILGLLGPNGAGKSTIIAMLTTLLAPSRGRITVAGYDIVKEGGLVRKNIGVVFQDFLLDDDLSALDNLDIHARICKLNKKERMQAIGKVLKIVDLKDEKNSKAGTFSGGMKRRLEIARGLLTNPKVLFLDEPTLGLDPLAKRNVWKYIKRLNREKNVTIVLTTNNMEEAENLCDRIAIISKGRLVALNTVYNIKKILSKKKSLEDVFIHLIEGRVDKK